MKAVVWHDVGDIRLDDVSEPKLKSDNDAVVRITASAICGTDLHLIRGTFTGMKSGRILGHEAIGIVEAVGKAVRNFRPGDRVIIPSTLGCGSCKHCRAGFYSQCNLTASSMPSASTPPAPNTTPPNRKRSTRAKWRTSPPIFARPKRSNGESAARPPRPSSPSPRPAP